jgi:hypothetical protein
MGESDAKMMRMGSGSKAVRFVGARIVSNDPRGCYAREGSQIKFIPDDRSEGRSFDVRGKLNNSVAGFHWITRWGNFTYAHNELGTLTLETGEWRDNLLPELQKTEMFIAEFAGDEILLQTHFRRTDGSEVLRVMSPGDDGLLRTAFETKVASGAHIIGACLIPKNKTKGKAEVVAECVSFFPKELGKMIWQYAY